MSKLVLCRICDFGIASPNKVQTNVINSSVPSGAGVSSSSATLSFADPISPEEVREVNNILYH